MPRQELYELGIQGITGMSGKRKYLCLRSAISLWEGSPGQQTVHDGQYWAAARQDSHFITNSTGLYAGSAHSFFYDK
jgi:hypothetical protein